MLFAAAAVLRVAASPQHPEMPAGMTHEQHLAQMEKDRRLREQGAAAMGFDQQTTTHHFRLSDAGGAIEVTANNPVDSTTRDQIRVHLKEIAAMFAAGDFSKPFATHGEQPPGIEAMRGAAHRLTFTYEDLPAGGIVRIRARDAGLRNAVHEFLRYQIREHATGDPLTIVK